MIRKFKHSILTLFFIFCFGVFGSRVNAYDYNKIRLSNSIYFPSLIFDTINIDLNNSYKDNNPFIRYQFISVTETQNIEINNGMNATDENLKSCSAKAEIDYDYKSLKDELVAQGKTYLDNEEYNNLYNDYVKAYNSCVEVYIADLKAVHSKIPAFDETKWIKQNISDGESSNYMIDYPNELEYFVLWINAKDKEGNDIYNVDILKNDNYKKDESLEESKQEETKEEPKQEETKEENINESKKENIKNPDTGIYGVCGISILCVILFVILRKKSFITKL